ncbi:hypothetical protein Sango_2100800 [Sesamum angolense]|uniref:Uncharacterized protein n=1 Tax=Sesamum angolense TaxID=2727404 RepID=A0AAE1WBR0_9LAMI|nr:hypothetical protein Sango_2100800 [Sesamum angolense]
MPTIKRMRNSRNVRPGLWMDGFAPYDRMYSCCPVILTPYNLLPRMCMISEYMFLTMVIHHGPSKPKGLIDVYLDLLIEELQNLWHVGVLAHDNVNNEIFTMRAVLMLTMNNIPAYGMASGWSTLGVMGCPICMEDTCAFYL